MFHLAILYQIFNGSGNLFNRYIRVNTVLIEQVNYICL